MALMGAPRKLPSGLWFVQVSCRGHRPSRAFASKSAAITWRDNTRREILDGLYGQAPAGMTVADLLDKYGKEVSANKKGKRWELVRISLLKRDRLSSVPLRVLDTPHLSTWQTNRLKTVSGASVNRERNLLNHVFNKAVKEWKLIKFNPLTGIARPPDSPPRDRIATDAELAKLLTNAGRNLARVIVWAVETGMRASEIAGLTEVRGNVAVILDSKNGTGRSVPLSKKALSVWVDGGFGLTAGSISAEFAKLTKRAGIEGLTFHDLRHGAATRLAKILNPYELSKMLGHKDLNMVLRVYYSQDAAETARKLG
ncbi:integrase [Caudoviricetes sp.]|nr:integrase [Caudoviricetes sp.]